MPFAAMSFDLLKIRPSESPVFWLQNDFVVVKIMQESTKREFISKQNVS
jgi:hypothetical protein